MLINILSITRYKIQDRNKIYVKTMMQQVYHKEHTSLPGIWRTLVGASTKSGEV